MRRLGLHRQPRSDAALPTQAASSPGQAASSAPSHLTLPSPSATTPPADLTLATPVNAATVSGSFTVTGTATTVHAVTWAIYDLTGDEAAHGQTTLAAAPASSNTPVSFTATVDVSSFAAGVYTFTVNTDTTPSRSISRTINIR